MMNQKKKKIILVNGCWTDMTNDRDIIKSHYKVYPVRSAAKLFEVLHDVKPDLVLLDMDTPGISIETIMNKLNENSASREIPVIVLTNGKIHESQLEAYNLFMADCLTKPVYGPLLLMLIEERLYPERIQEDLQGRLKKVPLWIANRISEFTNSNGIVH